jgi:phytoene dehydrogenase-like protein
MIEKYDYIVIGAGIAGLHIGALLSQHGKVLVLEKAKEIGGRARVADINGFKLDFGPHPVRFGPKSALGASLNEINKPINFIKPGTSWAFLDDGTKTIFPSGGIMAVIRSKLVPMIKTLKFMIKIKKMSVRDFEKLYDLSLVQWFDQENIIPSLQKFLIMASSAIQVNPFPDRSSAGELLHNFSRVLELGSVSYPKGGWTSIFNAFVNKIKDNGGEIRLNEEVNKIIVENSTAIGVSTKDKLIHGKTIISTIPIQQLFTVLDETLCEKKFIEKCKSLRPTAGVSIDFCLSKSISDINGIIFFDNPLAFGFIPSNLSPEVAPKGKSLMTFFTAANLEEIKGYYFKILS